MHKVISAARGVFAAGRRRAALVLPLPATTTAPHVPALDGLRGWAVLLVLLDHASDAGMRLAAGVNLNHAGKGGVQLFFVLSAFLLTLPFCQTEGPKIAEIRMWLNYLLRRFLRIFPLYALVLAVLIPAHKATARDFVTHLLLRDGQHQFWSIPVEVKYYLVLPIVGVALVFLRRRAWWQAIVASVAAIGISTAIFHVEQAWSLIQVIQLARHIIPFLAGSAAAYVYAVALAPRAAAGRVSVVLEACAFVALGSFVLRLPVVYEQAFGIVVRKMPYDQLVLSAVWTVLILGTLGGTGYLRRGLSWAPLRYLGMISYSLYLWHRKFISDVDDFPVPMQLRLVVFLAIVIAVATVTYFLVERPLSRIRLPAG